MLNSPWIRKPDFHNVKEINYDDYWKHRGWQLNGALKPREKIMLRIIPSGARVIDVGCGNSLLPVKLKEKGCSVAVTDVSETVLDQYGKLGIQGFHTDLNKIDISKFTGKADYIILSEVLEHMNNPEQIIKILSPHTNHFLITVPNSAYYLFRLGLMFKGRFFTQWVYHPSEHLRYWSHIDFLDWLDAQGLQVLSSEPSDGFTAKKLLPFLPALWKNLFGFRMVYLCKVSPQG
jgi:methionine biosynthesis protein MetW